MLTVSNVSKRFGEHSVLEHISFVVNRGERIALVGPNGSGKSTLLSILAGRLAPESGSVKPTAPISVGYLRQGFADLEGGTLETLLDEQLDGLVAAHRALEAATAALSAQGSAITEFARASEEFEQRGGYARLDELGTLLDRFGLGNADLESPLAELSGGEKTRAGLAALLARGPDLLLLDEPTNHLDIDALGWLEMFVRGYRGAVLIVSHDRAFIDATATSVLELDDRTHAIRSYPGNYSNYLDAKRCEESALQDAFERQQREIARIERDIRSVASHGQQTERETTDDYIRGRAKKVARTAKVRERKLDRLLESEDRIDRPAKRWALALDLAASGETGRDVISIEGLSVAYGERKLLSGIDLLVRSGERVALTGPNGAGKSTLLRVIAGLQPLGAGRVRHGASVKFGMFAQEQETGTRTASALDQIRAAAAGEESEARAFLHKFLFTGDNVHRPASELSYGERARLSLALLVRRGANVLLLDEPLNHLDLQSRERFEEALLGFDGTVLMVMHDRYAIERLATRVLELRDGKLQER